MPQKCWQPSLKVWEKVWVAPEALEADPLENKEE